jgi:NCAIR mutase (PurE)-related protein
MNSENIIKLLQDVKNNEIEIEEAVNKLKELPFTDIDYALIDNHRQIRTGFPEVIYCAGKTPQQVKGIVEAMLKNDKNILATRATKEMYDLVKEICNEAVYNELGRTITIKKETISESKDYILIAAAGTSDLPVVEEAYETCKIFGNRVEKVVDIGVAGIHRLFSRLELIRGAKVIIVVAGMEGALASVIGGLVDKPIIAVPTSVGYGANFGGIAALLSMLNSCAGGVSVVNIDNGFGAAYSACMINRL